MKLFVPGPGLPGLTNIVRAAMKLGMIVAAAALLLAPTLARAAEHSLAGIKIFASEKEVLDRFGNPTHILTGADVAALAPSAATATASGPGAPAPGQPPAMRPPEFGGGSGGPNPGGGAPATPGTAANVTTGEVMYVYDKPNGVSLDFLLSPDGRVIQISVLGYKGTVRTTRGVTLGTLYTSVIKLYGYPEEQDTINGILTMKYLNKQHVAFDMDNNKVVGITVAAME